MGKRDVGGFTEGSSPGEVELEATQEGRGWGQWTDNFPRRPTGKERRETEQQLEGEAVIEVGFFEMGETYL